MTKWFNSFKCTVCGIHTQGWQDGVWTSGGHGWHCLTCWGWFLKYYISRDARVTHTTYEGALKCLSN
jgi:hypothetical protein